MKNRLLIPALAVLIVGGAVFGVSRVAAENSTSSYPPIIEKLVQKFGLNENEVRAVFEEDRSERRAQNQARFEERLVTAVSEGKLTEEQKQLILQKHNQLQSQRQAEMESMRDLTPEQRHEKMQERQAEMKSWASENGIDISWITGGMGMKGGFGRGR